MSSQITIKPLNEVFVGIEGEESILWEIADEFTFTVPNYQFMPAYKKGHWDGRIRLFKINFKVRSATDSNRSGEIYKGLVGRVMDFCEKMGYTYTTTFPFSPNKIPNDAGYFLAKYFEIPFTLRDYQNEAVVQCLRYDRKIILSPTASGKSLILYLLMRYHQAKERKTLIIVPTTNLVSQLATDFEEYNNNLAMPFSVHTILSGKPKSNDQDLIISTWQSIYKLPKKWFREFDVVMGDEAHGFKAKSLTSIMEKCDTTKYRYAFTGTLDDMPTNELVIEGLFGPQKQVTTTKELMDRKEVAKLDIKCIILDHGSVFSYTKARKQWYNEEMNWLVENESRNRFIIQLADTLKGNILLMFRKISHGKRLHELADDLSGRRNHLVYGDTGVKDREAIRKIIDAGGERNNIIEASYGVFSAGVNMKNIDYVIFGSPYKSKIKVLQTIGRGLRMSNTKQTVTLFDIIDDLRGGIDIDQNYSLQHFESRLKLYTTEGFEYTFHKTKLGA